METPIEKAIRILRQKADNTGTNTKESRARKGAYVDAIITLKEELDNPSIETTVKTAEEFFRSKIKELKPNQQWITLSQELVSAELSMRWAHEFASQSTTQILSELEGLKAELKKESPFGKSIKLIEEIILKHK